MYPERTNTCTNIAQLKIPHGTIAALADISASKVSEYVKQLDVSGRASSQIERAVGEIADLVTLTEREFGFAPNLRDVPKLRDLLDGLKQARYLVARHQLVQVEREVATVLQEMASLS